MSRVSVQRREVWGLRRPDGTILLYGFGEVSLVSEEDVRSSFDKALFERGFVPVHIRTITTITEEHTG